MNFARRHFLCLCVGFFYFWFNNNIRISLSTSEYLNLSKWFIYRGFGSLSSSLCNHVWIITHTNTSTYHIWHLLVVARLVSLFPFVHYVYQYWWLVGKNGENFEHTSSMNLTDKISIFICYWCKRMNCDYSHFSYTFHLNMIFMMTLNLLQSSIHHYHSSYWW